MLQVVIDGDSEVLIIPLHPPPSLEEDTQGENVSAVINFGRTGGYLDQQSPHNELGKHHSSQNLKKQTRRPLCQRDTHINSAVSSVRWKRHQRPSLAIAWIPANGLCDIQTVTDGYEMKGALSLVFHQNDSSFSPGPPN